MDNAGVLLHLQHEDQNFNPGDYLTLLSPYETPFVLHKAGRLRSWTFTQTDACQYIDIRPSGMTNPVVAIRGQGVPFYTQAMGGEGNAWVRIFTFKNRWFDFQYYLFDKKPKPTGNCGLQVINPETGAVVVDSSWQFMIPGSNYLQSYSVKPPSDSLPVESIGVSLKSYGKGFSLGGNDAFVGLSEAKSSYNGILYGCGTEQSGDDVLIKWVPLTPMSAKITTGSVYSQFYAVKTETLDNDM